MRGVPYEAYFDVTIIVAVHNHVVSVHDDYLGRVCFFLCNSVAFMWLDAQPKMDTVSVIMIDFFVFFGPTSSVFSRNK